MTRDLSTPEGRQSHFDEHGKPMVKVEALGELHQQTAWEDYETVTPNLHVKGIRRVEQHIGFDAAWDLLAPLLNAETERANRAEAKLRENAPARLYRVDFELDTGMWNEGFEKAEEPWLRIYTDNTDWVNRLEKVYSVIVPGGSRIPQMFFVETLELATDRPTPSQAELDAEDEDASYDGHQSTRFVALTPGQSSEVLDLVLGRWLAEWTGV